MRIRDYINIVESSGRTLPLPSFEQVVDDEYLDDLFDFGGIHPGDPHSQSGYPSVKKDFYSLERLLSDLGFDSDDLENPSARQAVLDWLPKRYRYVANRINKTAQIRDGGLLIFRNIAVNPMQVAAIRDGQTHHGLGEFWSFDLDADVGAPWATTNDEVLTMQALVDPHQVDWLTTMRRNMDYIYGDEESEIFLPHGTPVTLIRIEYDGEAAGPDTIKNPHRTT